MANENVPTPAPTRFDDQILPFVAWVPIGNSNFILDLQKKQKNIIFQISVDILQNTNFFRAFTASALLDDDWFILETNLLREALEITPIDQAHQFVSPPSGDAIMDFVNQLGYPGEIHFVSRMAVNNLYQPWRAILLMINQCLTSNTSGFYRPRYPILQMLWGIIIRTNIDNADLMWEEFVQVIQTFLVDKANLGSLTKKGKNTKPHVIPYSRFTKLILLWETSQYSQKHERKIAAEIKGGKKKMAPKADKPMKTAPAKQAKLAPAKQPKPKPVKENSTKPKPTPPQKAGKATQPLPVVEGKGKAIATEEQVAQSLLALHTPKRRSTTDQFIFQRQTSATKEASIGPSTQPQNDTSANIVRETPSPTNDETGIDMDNVINEGDAEILNINEEQEEYMGKKVYLEEQTAELDEGQAISDPGKTSESRPPPDDDKMDEDHAGSDPGRSHVALVGLNPNPMHDDFDPPSSSGTLSSIKILDDTYTFGDQFFKDKSTKDEPGKQNVDTKVVSMVTVPIYQASTSVPPLSTPIIDLSPPKLVDYPRPEPLNRFRELPKANVKEILHQRMFESGSYKSLPKHVALYEALEASMKRANRDGFLTEKDKSRKRHRDDQDPPPLPDSDLSKKKRHYSDAFGSKQPPALQIGKKKLSKSDLEGPAFKRLGADYNEYKISEADFKNLHPNDFEDLYRLHLQDFLFKEDYTIVSKPRAVIYIDKNDQMKILRENEVHIKMEMVSSCFGKDKFITACSYVTNTFKEIMKAQAYVFKLLQL
uniref:Monodehydroascorbate reductase n=1 Tax=Tanacetum cinerariifolium TaxID=118510 RepID=A0A6L2MKC1_TANCI|nr:hypothetical protein [Tanacetum cinerariifolium]